MIDPTQTTNPAQAGRWCEHHGRWECTRQRNRGRGVCHSPAIRGLDACRMHVGKRAEVARAQGEARAEAFTAWSALAGGAAPVVSDKEAVLGMLQVSWLRVHLYMRLLREQVEAAQQARDDEGPRAGGDGSAGVPDVGSGAGLVGHTMSGVKGIGIFATREATRGLARLEAEERERVVKFAKTAHDMGIDEAQIRLAERQGELLAGVVRRVAAGLLAALLPLLAEHRALTERVRAAWDDWLADIASRELRAAAGSDGDAR